jgi:energy-coupling factor transport system substrate-specific component
MTTSTDPNASANPNAGPGPNPTASISPNAGKLTAKDLITTAIFTVVTILIFFVGSMTFGMVPVLYPFLIGFIALPGGIVWVYMRVKVPKRFAILMQCVVMTLVFWLMGIGPFLALGILVGGILAEVISGLGRYRSFALNTAGYAALAFCIHVGAFLVVLVARDYYYDFCVSGGMTVEWTNTFLNFMSWPMLLGTGVLAVIGAVLGMLLGRVMLKKHFVKAGMV